MSKNFKHCLLVVDDEPNVCDSIEDLLRREFRVLKASNAEEGMKLMQENEVHLILTDQRMPHITGVEFLSRIRTRHPQAMRMLFTGYADLESIIAAINQGHIYQFMRKPWKPEELLAAVRDAAAEYDRLVQDAEEKNRLENEVSGLKERVAVLESEVEKLGGEG
jgi:response regulator RpfG family c-di-GMP phosphodiesterase